MATAPIEQQLGALQPVQEQLTFRQVLGLRDACECAIKLGISVSVNPAGVSDAHLKHILCDEIRSLANALMGSDIGIRGHNYGDTKRPIVAVERSTR